MTVTLFRVSELVDEATLARLLGGAFTVVEETARSGGHDLS